ncbi:glycosyltransferase family 2 protein [Neolewinella lacunae]|uniref:Glycosyltransferase family 2 protein n=1 Tax=Neolewinella lacunae TaxID=1517758 RepID=A0A923T775_9BACT|nr:glycosyltransferase family 2 protein [Neolewinella lacunae]MBC6994195.1 glycosyltransferase family 2 protein [Neolewinella lacunae]MDN3634646.1 glycosyltransferase family 2 protein [Neolewinella lacunae]
MRPLSIIYTTHNEIDIIERSLATVAGWSDDLVVVDSFSTDGTAELLAGRPDVILRQRAYQGPAEQKNWAIERARHEWILLLDADELVTPALRQEIDALLAAAELPYDAYWIGRDNHFMGKRIYHSGWAGDKVVRFFHRDRARYDGKQVHEEIVTEGLRVGWLRGRLEHYTFKSLEHFLDKTRRYARWSAQDYAARTPRVGFYHLLVKPVYRFCKHYLLQGGFRDGREGLMISAVLAWGVFLRYAYLLTGRR